MSIDAIAQSGLHNAHIALNSVAQNIANAEADWYSRRNVIATPRQTASASTVVFAGVEVQAVERLAQTFQADQLFRSSAEQSALVATVGLMQKLDSLFSSEDSGLTSAITNFLQALGQAEAKPESLPLREQILGSANILSHSYQQLSQQTGDLFRQLTREINSTVAEVNRLTPEISQLNQSIRALQGSGSDAGHLLDRRNAAINRLATLTGVMPRYETDDTITLAIQSGHTLVSGAQAYSLTYEPGHTDPLRPQILLNHGKRVEPLLLNSGKLSSLMTFNEQVLLPVMNELGWQARMMSEGVNQYLSPQNKNSELLFNDPDAISNNLLQVIPAAVQGSGKLSVYISDTSQTQASEYRLVFTAPETGQIIRLKDDRMLPVLFSPSNSALVDGLDVRLTGSAQVGDTYHLLPWRRGAEEIKVIMSSAENLMFTDDPTKPGDNSRLTGLIHWLSGLDATGPDLSAAWMNLQANTASQTAGVEQQLSLAESLHQSALSEINNYSGVNLDEEAAKLVRYQQLYQANATLFKVNQAIIEELLSWFR